MRPTGSFAARRAIRPLLFLVGACLFAAGCGARDGSSPAAPTVYSGTGPLEIVATTGPVGDMVRNIVGDHGRVEVMMGPGVDPHTYQELPSDIAKIDSADIVFYNGLHLEGSLTEVLERLAKKQPIFAVTSKLEETQDTRIRRPKEEFDGFADPHVWHDASLWADCVPAVVDRLAQFDPARADDYRAAGEAYRAELLELHEECKQQIASVPEQRRVMVTAHDAFSYFSRAYGLESVGLKGISTADEISIDRMEEVAALVIERELPAVFCESSVAPKVVEALIEPCLEQGHEVRIAERELYADSLGPAASGADTYAGMMRANVASIVHELGGNASEAE